MSQVKHIAIIGAGIAGLALAIFARQQGIKVTIYEQQASFSSLGAGITLWPNASFVIHQMGLLDKVKRIGGCPSVLRQFDKQGTQQNAVDIQQINRICGFPSITILRRDLVQILVDAMIQLGVEVHFKQRLNAANVEQLQQQFDLVVGCDGRMHSVTRQHLYNHNITPVFHGFLNIIGVSKRDVTPGGAAIHEYRQQAERFGIVPVTSEACYWAAAWPCALDHNRQSTDWYSEMRRRFQHWPQLIQNVLDSCEPHQLKTIFVHDIDPLPYWHSENVLIIGDAAHAPLPTSGQGACQALEDAWHLSQLLPQEAPLDTLLQQFYHTRIHKVTLTQQLGRQVAQRIFKSSETTVEPAEVSTEQICQLYMQGLTLEQ